LYIASSLAAIATLMPFHAMLTRHFRPSASGKSACGQVTLKYATRVPSSPLGFTVYASLVRESSSVDATQAALPKPKTSNPKDEKPTLSTDFHS
jgi:hypothetical protein